MTDYLTCDCRYDIDIDFYGARYSTIAPAEYRRLVRDVNLWDWDEMAQFWGVSVRTAKRWVSGHLAVPTMLVLALTLLRGVPRQIELGVYNVDQVATIGSPPW
jgi:hypothetical protein